ncbi:UNVERIFIED_CONTAM: hypothetical protein Sindi_0558600 [Sesamum indicum]
MLCLYFYIVNYAMSTKGKAAIGSVLQFLQIRAWSRIAPLCPSQPYDMDSDVIMAYAAYLKPQLWRLSYPLIFYAIVEMHRSKWVLRHLG